MGRPRAKNIYMTNEELYEQVALSQQNQCPTEKLGELLLRLHEHILMHKNFNGYSTDLKEEMVGFSLEKLLRRGIYTFKLDMKDKCFSYFTRSVFFNFYTIIMRHYKKLNERRKYYAEQIAKYSCSDKQKNFAYQLDSEDRQYLD